ncbi:DNA-protecting protein DprA [Dysgonomonas sp. Marseille-P4677]|uniref:DNA-processing protein DprA n=1 Tax=Dysgonomonas sp. Marseille-P4677 TaxID=2364790 RepID=UPI0019125D26|nr:DNA-processing protein DprA [Dysgonomonas sp. Marseille-P4677]MBK5721889.1 DNA-protecting protein DprA [Dysgonomonas sp. Marseille-P4677]
MNTSLDKRLYQIALTQISGVGDITARNLLQVVGDEEAIFKSGRKALLNIQGLQSRLVDEILSPQVLIDAEKELNFIEKNNISTYFISDKNYPYRLKDCADAPILFYFKGKTDFNVERVISIVGTRNSTNYGNSFCDSFLEKISLSLPDTLIISGLAYGIDINAHRAALKYKLPTIGVLAHGLDIIYPSVHRNTALEMINNGGLLSEFQSKTEPDRFNFVRRNRIVAGMVDAIIVVESDDKGGSLITAEIANSYCKDVFAVPGRMTDKYSRGCNKLIASHKADLFQSTEYFLQQMGWDDHSQKKKKMPRQQDLFIVLTSEEQLIVDKLTTMDSLHIDQLARELNIPAYQLFTTLLELEMKGVIKNLPGNLYTLS